MRGGVPQSNIGWDEKLVIRSKSATTSTPSSASSNTAKKKKQGGPMSEEESQQVRRDKLNAAAHSKSDHRHVCKVDREEEDFHVKTVSLDVGRTIQKGRLAINMTQKELATKINEKPSIVTDYEQGKGQPNQQILGRMERVLGIRLRGKDIGQALPQRVAKVESAPGSSSSIPNSAGTSKK